MSLVLLIDLAPVDGGAPAEQERILLDELGRYRPELLDRPRLVVGSKADVAADDPGGPGPAGFSGMRISAVTREGVDRFLGILGTMVDEARAAEPVEEGFVVLRPAEEGFSVGRDDDGAFRVRGRAAERVVAMADMTNTEALAYVQDRFRRMGVERALDARRCARRATSSASATSSSSSSRGSRERLVRVVGVDAPIRAQPVGRARYPATVSTPAPRVAS